jgi:hypothetical protein
LSNTRKPYKTIVSDGLARIIAIGMERRTIPSGPGYIAPPIRPFTLAGLVTEPRGPMPGRRAEMRRIDGPR